MRKNVAGQVVGAQLVSASDGSAFTGAVTAYVTGDGGTQAVGSVGSGACTHEGNGYHTYAPAQAETNYDLVAVTFTGTGAIPVSVQIYTRPTTGLLAPTVLGRTLDVTATGAAGIDWANVENPTTTVALTGTTAGLIDDAITAAKIAANAIGASELAADAATEIAAAVWDRDTLNLTTGVGAFLVALDARTIDILVDTGTTLPATLADIQGATFDAATDSLEAIRNRGDLSWITATGFSTHSAADVWSVATRVLTANTNLNDPTAAAIADAVWDEVLSGHLTGGTTGNALNAAGSAGDPWTTTLPGAYTGSQAGKILADVLADTGELQTNQGNWVTATGFSTHSAADVWAVATRVLTAGTNIGFPTAGAIADAVWDEAAADHGTLGSFGATISISIPNSLVTISGNVIDVLDDTANAIPGLIANLPTDADVNAQCDTAISDYFGTAGSSLTGIPWNAAWDEQVQSEVKDALDATVDDAIHADGSRPSVSSGIYLLCQYLTDVSISGTVMTIKKPDGSTTLLTVDLNNGTDPTSKTRAT